MYVNKNLKKLQFLRIFVFYQSNARGEEFE